ncbi:MAG: DNA polymerase III subunit gamma/tau [Streptococcaceae bacterium]|nr:DNA polymerase III subunit gamma/tau [Streptococcaceae bacterium]
MSYQALYRKYRSQRFDEMVGQKIVATTLKNAIINGQISHAYLFSGPRGTGKTSAAKIFAKAINCPNQKDGEPCNDCYICESITKGTLDDVIELDAASNNGVDEIREIRDKSTYAASQATYKIYIIDEVHMLSTGAFNALLKTLEEPTENVVFVLATTELQKIPATIISRVQRFAFKSITTADIHKHLQEVLDEESVKYEDKALTVISKSAEGGMRDALSLLDQALSFSDVNSGLQEKDALLVTGSIAEVALVDYVNALSNSDEKEALEQLDKLFSEGKNMLRFTEDLLAYFRDMLLDKESPISYSRLYQWTDITIESMKNIKETSQTKVAADVMTLRLSEISDGVNAVNSASASPDLLAEIQSLKSELARLKAESSTPTLSSERNTEREVEQVTVPNSVNSTPVSVNRELIYKALEEATNEARHSIVEVWDEIVQSFNKPSEKALIKNTQPVAASENYVVVTFPHENLAKRVMENDDLQLQFGNLLSRIVDFSPKILALAEEQWSDLRSDYVASRHSSTPDYQKEAPTEDEGLSQAKALFGDKVVEIRD